MPADTPPAWRPHPGHGPVCGPNEVRRLIDYRRWLDRNHELGTLHGASRRSDRVVRLGLGMRIHVIKTGRLVGNETIMRGEGWSSVFRRRRRYEFPAHCFIIEHPEGLIAIDTGLTARVRVPASQRRISPSPLIETGEEIGPQARAAGLNTEEVQRVVLTHLDWDHAGGLEHFPNAEVLVHRPEHEFAQKAMGKWRYQPKLWPSSFAPTLCDLDPAPYGPFPKSKALTESGDVRLVPIPGHSIGQLGVIVQTDDVALFFAADHALRQDWFVDDYEAGRLLMLGALFFPKLAAETSRRIHRFIREIPTVFIPSHDADAPARLAAMEPLKLNA
jgi:N-acyl homoserine lactone hydrolase